MKADLYGLAVIGVLLSAVGAYYYLRIVKLMYFDAPITNAPKPASHFGARVVLGLNAAAVLGLGLVPGSLLDLCARILH